MGGCGVVNYGRADRGNECGLFAGLFSVLFLVLSGCLALANVHAYENGVALEVIAT